MNIVLPNWFGLDIDKVYELMEGDLRYLGTFGISKNGDNPVAVFHSKNPDRSKNHKDYMLLYRDYANRLTVSGLDEIDIKDDLIQSAMHCKECGDVIYSVARHDYRSCTCGNCFVDGGKSYMRSGWKPGSQYEYGTIDFFKGVFTSDTARPSTSKAKISSRKRTTKRKDSSSG